MMSDVSIANAQLVAIATGVSYDSDLIIIDEPTSALTETEVEHLFRIIRDLKETRNIAVVYISHKLDGIFAVCDEVSILRDGEFVGSDRIENMDKDKLISMMVGRSMDEFFSKEAARRGEVLMSVKNFSPEGKFRDVSFDLRRGEVLGIGGLMGAGRTELMESIFGYYPPDSREIRIRGERVEITKSRDAIASTVIGGTSLSGGVGSIPLCIVGALIIDVINNGMDLLGVNAYWQQVVKGLIIVLAVLIDSRKQRKK